MIMIGVVSDTHVPTRALAVSQQILTAFEAVDMILHCGDITVLSVLDKLNTIAPVYAVAGNMDSGEIKRFLPEKRVVVAGNKRIGVIHGAGVPFGIKKRIIKAFAEDNVDCIVYGHTHHADVDIVQDTLLFNPGSASDDHGSFGLLFIDDNDRLDTKIIYL
ncbi:MAG: metallophosphoesterase family protein [Candidatus Auribacterota bacterium]